MQLHRVRLRHAAAKRALRKLRSQAREAQAAGAQEQAGLQDLQAAQQQARLQLDGSRKQRDELQVLQVPLACGMAKAAECRLWSMARAYDC